jgi:tetratricopeptide (TPR) repeat protein
MTAKGERAPFSAASEEDGMTRSLSGTDLQAERLSGGPNPVAITPASRLYERALTLVAMGFLGEATTILRDISVRLPGHAPVWKKLAELLRLAGKDREANGAMSQAADGSTLWAAASDSRTPAEIVAAERALLERVGALKTPPERLKELRDYLRGHETDAPAMRVLGRFEQESGNLITARALFERALVLAPDYDNARADLALLLLAMGENKRAVAESGLLISRAPANIEYRALHANALCAVGDFDPAISMIEQVVRAKSTNARARRVYARSLYIAGRREDSAREYRACLALEPGMAEAYGGLADLRGDYLTANDIAAMRERLRDSDLDLESRRTIQYALGHALERARDFSGSFAAYEAGVALSQTVAANRNRTYSPAKRADELARRRAVFSRPLLARGAPAEKPPHTPIFVVGMPRAGSTLVEQILASHRLVEGTMELPVLANVVRDLSLRRLISKPDAYPECITELNAFELADLGTHYLEECKAYRRTNRPYFIDKGTSNWLDAGLIRLVLPHAKIVDVRREPMAACFAMYKQQLKIDVQFPYGFRELVHFYTQYAGMMAYYETAMAGHIHFLSYERLVEDTESEIRRLLKYCGLPFEESCLRFWETGRAVATPSGEQVRQPIYRGAVEQWRNFEPWLGPLKEALKEAETVAAAAPR